MKNETLQASVATTARESTEVAPAPEIAKRRQFSPSYKRRIVRQADAFKGDLGAIGRLLRREGLYSSHLSNWRAEIALAEEHALQLKTRGPKPDAVKHEARRIGELETENATLKARLHKAEAIIDIQKKVCALLGIAPATKGGE